MSPRKYMNLYTRNEDKFPLMLRLRGTVIVKIWWKVIFVTLYTGGIVYLHNFGGPQYRMNYPLVLVSILGVVMGLLLVFRNNTAYDRYYEGRRIWSQMTQTIRKLTRTIWVCIEEREESGTSDILEKVSAINLLIAFAFSLKNYLREEYSYDEENIRDLIGHLPRFSTMGNRNGRDSAVSNCSNKNKSRCCRKKSKKKQYKFKAHDFLPPTNIPIEISYYLSSYVQSVKNRSLCDSTTLSNLHSSIAILVDCFTGLERILRTPIPLAYSVHLHHSLWIYIFALPYQLVGQLNWLAIPAVGIASFALLGLLTIGWEIENPFGYDENDLPLDDFCEVIRLEIQTILATTLPPPDTWILSKRNYPLSSMSSLNAEELSLKTPEEIRSILRRDAADGTVSFRRQSSKDKQDENQDVTVKMIIATDTQDYNEMS